MYQTSEAGLRRIVVVSEDISRPVDEGFKKATVLLTAAIEKIVPGTLVFTKDPARAALEAGPLPRNKLLWGKAFSRTLTRFDPEAVVYFPEAAGTPMSMARARSLKRQSGGRPIVLVALQRRPYPAHVRPFLRWLRPDLLLVLSGRALGEARAAGFRAARITLGVDTEVFKPPGPGMRQELRSKYSLPAGKILLHIGHLVRGRNLELLLSLAGEDTHLLVVTSTATRRDPAVEAMLRRSRIMIVDEYVEHIEEIYRAVDGYVFPTFSPTDAIDIPLSVLEAMATNLAVVTSDFGGLKDLFAPGDGLFVCSTEDEMVKAARRMFDLESVATRDKVLGFTWERAARSLLETIETELV
jgi:hypothetical protein